VKHRIQGLETRQVASFKATYRKLISTVTTLSILSSSFWSAPAQAKFLPYCQQTLEGMGEKTSLRQGAAKGDKKANRRYQDLLKQHAQKLRQCRNAHWLKDQAIWIRLYPCDAAPGRLEEILDQIVNRGYTQVYVETFYNGQVLLPAADNPTPWGPVLSVSGYEQVDLLAEMIRKGHERGLGVYAWMFSMNFGYGYGIRSDRQSTLARNGWGQTTLTLKPAEDDRPIGTNEVFIDPYNLQAREDYARMVRAVAKRRPDGMLFDYIRYPRQTGSLSVANRVQDLWIYSDSAQKTLLLRAQNQKGQALIRRYISRGELTVEDVQAVDQQFPAETDPPLWQGRTPVANENQYPLADRRNLLQVELWRLSVGHAMQGVVDFLSSSAAISQQAGIPAGAVFFPSGNQMVGQGFDSRLQPWDRFPTSIDWHPMAYAACGSPNCVMNEVQRVISMAPRGTRVKPVLAGIWQQTFNNHPPLELQMQGMQQILPSTASVSHFVYSWQEPLSDQERKSCRLSPS
jgi:hypothetical protein